MGNRMSCVSLAALTRLQQQEAASEYCTIKFFDCETGAVSELEGPLTAAEAMLEFPAQFLCSLSSAMSSRAGCGRRICAVIANEELQAAELYLLLPMHRLNSRFSMEEIGFFASLGAAQRVKRTEGSNTFKGRAISHRKVAPTPAASAASVSHQMLQSHAEAEDALAMVIRSQLPSLKRLQSMNVDPEGPASAYINYMGAAKKGVCRSKSWMPKLETVDEFSVVS